MIGLGVGEVGTADGAARARLIARAEALRESLRDELEAADWWNRRARQPHELRREPDPDGRMFAAIDAIDRFLERARRDRDGPLPLLEW